MNGFIMTQRRNVSRAGALAGLAALLLNFTAAPGQQAVVLPVVRQIEWQPFSAQVKRVLEALDYLGSPYTTIERQAIDAALAQGDAFLLQQRMDVRCLVGVHINPEMRVKVQQGIAPPDLVEQGWRVFLVKVENDSGTTAKLTVESDSFKRLPGSPQSEVA